MELIFSKPNGVGKGRLWNCLPKPGMKHASWLLEKSKEFIGARLSPAGTKE